MRIKNGPQLPGAGRTRAGHHHGSHTPTSPGTILLGKMPITPNKSAGSVLKESIITLNYQDNILKAFSMFTFQNLRVN